MNPPDQKARQSALDPAQSFLVRAPAGSGKTTLLVSRFLKLLAIVNRPEEILAITFTRKATAEMRERILKELRNPDNPAAVAALKRSEEKDWDLLNQTRRLQIKTIDAFCSELAHRCPWTSQFGAPVQIVENAQLLYQQAAQKTLEIIHQPKDPRHSACAELLQLLEARLPYAQQLLGQMLAHRDQWLPKMSRDQIKRTTIEQDWKAHVTRQLETIHQTLTPFAKHLNPLLKYAGENSQNETHHCLDGFPKPNTKQLNKWRALCNLLLTQAGTFRKGVTAREGFPPKTEEKEQMNQLLETFAEQPGLNIFLHQLSRLPDPEFSDTEWAQLSALCELLPLATSELQLLFRDTGKADFCEIGLRAKLALGTSEQPSDLLLTYDYRIQHLLIDEFQDTTIRQIDLVEHLLEGWITDEGRSLFFVGDPQQSIYLFRDAEVGNFLKVAHRGVGGIQPEELKLASNFRSTPGLIKWQNRVFGETLGQIDDSATGLVSHAKSEPGKPGVDDEGPVFIHHHIDLSEEEHAAAVADLIEQEIKAMKTDQTIAVLGRVRRHLHGIAAELRVRGVKFTGLDLEPLGSTPHIQDCVHLTRALLTPTDRTAWLAVLRAPWCGFTWRELTHLTGDDRKIPLHERIADPPADFPDEAKCRLTRIQGVFAAAIKRRGRIPIAENVEAAWLALGGLALCAAPARADCRRYFALLAEQDASDAPIDIIGISEMLDQLYSASAGDAQVQLLTIHRAKGLEFDSVIIPSLLPGGRGDDSRLLNYLRLPDEFLLAGLKPRDENSGANKYDYLNELIKQRHQNELRRLLYVATTRAKQRLHLVAQLDGEDPKPRKNSFLELLWEPVNATPATRIETKPSAASMLLEPEIERLPENWQPPPWPDDWAGLPDQEPPPEPVDFDWAGEPARRAGEVLHAELQGIGASGWEAWRKRPVDDSRRRNWERQLREHGLLDDELARALNVLVKGVEQARENPKAAWIFSPEHQDIHCEWALSGELNGKIVNGIIDRSFIADGKRWVVDFKSSSHEGGDLKKFLDQEQARYHNQMTRYAELIAGLAEEYPVHLALYYPLLGGWREWAAAESPNGEG